jgi:hypothetical protein
VSYVSSIWPAVGIELLHTAAPVAASMMPYRLQALVDAGAIRAIHRFTAVDKAGKVTLRVLG